MARALSGHRAGFENLLDRHLRAVFVVPAESASFAFTVSPEVRLAQAHGASKTWRARASWEPTFASAWSASPMRPASSP